MRSSSIKISYPEGKSFKADDLFLEARLKLYWARLHAHKLSMTWEKSVVDHYDAATGGKTKLYYSLSENLLTPPIHPAIPLGIGDVIRNLRSALDYLVSAMARKAGLPDNHTIFPFSKLKSGIEASFNEPVAGSEHRKGRKAGALYALSRENPELKNIILDRIKPYSAEDGADAFGDLLWRVITADNVDKHRLMTPSVTRTDVSHAKTTDGFAIFGLTIVGEFTIGSDAKLQKESDFSVDIIFGDPATLAGKPVTGTLVEGIEAVSNVIEIFGQEFA